MQQFDLSKHSSKQTAHVVGADMVGGVVANKLKKKTFLVWSPDQKNTTNEFIDIILRQHRYEVQNNFFEEL